jgi:hypothetical protein
MIIFFDHALQSRDNDTFFRYINKTVVIRTTAPVKSATALGSMQRSARIHAGHDGPAHRDPFLAVAAPARTPIAK